MVRLVKRYSAFFLSSFLTVNIAFAAAAPTELTLDESIALALRNNPSVKVAQADKDKAAWFVNEAKAGKQPTLSYAHTAIHGKSDPSASSGQTYDKFDNKITLSVPLYTGGKVEGAIEQARLGLNVADLSVAKTKQQVKLDATTGYFSLLQSENMVKLNQESVDRLMAHLKNVQAQYAVGTVAKTDVLRSEVELANAEQNLIKAQNSYDLAMASLNNVVGLPLDTSIKVKEVLKYEKYNLSLEQAVQQALTSRPESAQADLNVDIAKQGIKVAQSGKKPAVSLNGATDWNKDKFPGDDNNNWSVYVAASFNLLDSGLTQSKVKQADAALTKAVEQSRQSKDGIRLEVRQAYLNMLEAEKRIQTSSVAVNKAEEDYKIAQVRYSAGVGTNLDVIDSQVALTQAKTNYVQALYDFNTSRAKLDKAIGVPVK